MKKPPLVQPVKVTHQEEGTRMIARATEQKKRRPGNGHSKGDRRRVEPRPGHDSPEQIVADPLYIAACDLLRAWLAIEARLHALEIDKESSIHEHARLASERAFEHVERAITALLEQSNNALEPWLVPDQYKASTRDEEGE